ncbi:unknown [Corallococcus sp. CAG:1435]|nr:unknown [Corallococcus sp. CAG:1435]
MNRIKSETNFYKSCNLTLLIIETGNPFNFNKILTIFRGCIILIIYK